LAPAIWDRLIDNRFEHALSEFGHEHWWDLAKLYLVCLFSSSGHLQIRLDQLHQGYLQQ